MILSRIVKKEIQVNTGNNTNPKTLLSKKKLKLHLSKSSSAFNNTPEILITSTLTLNTSITITNTWIKERILSGKNLTPK